MRGKVRQGQWTGAAALALASALPGCGGEESGPTPAPVAAAPALVPAPTPSPTPTPTGARDPKFASAAIGETIGGPLICSDGLVTTGPSGEATGVGPITRTKNDGSIQITYLGQDSYRTDINGFGGAAFTPEIKRTFPSPVYARFSSPQAGELLLGQYSLTFVTFGAYADSSLCFFAVGLPAASLPGVAVSYSGIVDGLAVIGGTQSRIFSGSASDATMDFAFAKGTGTLSLNLVRRADPFGNFEASTPVNLGTVTANITLEAGRRSFTAPLAGAGYTGTVIGLFVDNGNSMLGKDVGGAGAALVYELRSPAGDLIYGTVALAANLL